MKLLVDGLSTKINLLRRELRVLVHPSGLDLSTSALRLLRRELAARRRRIGTRWRRLTCGRQALPALAHLRCGHTFAQLAAGFGVGLATAHRYVTEAVDVLATLAPTLQEAMTVAARKAFVILDGTLLPIDRIAADRPSHSGEHRKHGVNVQVLTDPFGKPIWASPALPGAVTRMSHQMIYLGRPQEALALLEVAGARAAVEKETVVRALVHSQTGRVHAALGDARKAAAHLDAADGLFDQVQESPPAWAAYFDAAEHAGARAVSARDLRGLGVKGWSASPHFQAALRLRAPGWERVRTMDRLGLAGALFDEGEPERGVVAGHTALDATGAHSALIAARVNALVAAAGRYRTPAVEELRVRARDLATRTAQAAQFVA